MMRLSKNILNLTGACILLLFSCGCGTDIIKLKETRAENAENDLRLYNEGKATEYGSLTLDDAINLGLQYNISLWLSQQEKAVQEELQTSSLLRMLPEFNIDINSDARDTYNSSSSVGLFTGQQSELTKYSFSSSKSHTYGGFGLLWNIMDFGVSFFRWKQSEKQTAIAEQAMLRARQNVAFDITAAYCRTATLKATVSKAKELMQTVDDKLKDIENRITSGDLQASAAYDSKYELLKYKQRINMYQENYKIAKVELARVMGIPVNATFSLSRISPDITSDDSISNVEFLEKTALLNRPELFQEDLEESISHDDARMALLQMLPTPSMMLRSNADDNKYLYYDNWTNWAMNLSWNLLAIPSRIFEARGHKKRTKYIQKKRMALAVAILSQLHIALVEYEHAQQQYTQSHELAEMIIKAVDNHKTNLGSGKRFTETDLLRKQVKLVDEFAGYMSYYARMMTARARIYNTLGLIAGKQGEFIEPDTVVIVEPEESFTAYVAPTNNAITYNNPTDNVIILAKSPQAEEATPVINSAEGEFIIE